MHRPAITALMLLTLAACAGRDFARRAAPLPEITAAPVRLHLETRGESVFARGPSALALEGRTVWGGSVVRSDDGLYHMLFNTWRVTPDGPPFRVAWVLRSEIGHAVSRHPDRGFEFRGIVLRGRRHDGAPDAWDAQMVTNPHLRRFNGLYHLYYVGSRDPGPPPAGRPGATLNARDRVQQSQRIGVITFRTFEDLAAGRFERPDRPLLAPRTRVKPDRILAPSPAGTSAKPDNIVVVNPSVVFDPVRRRYLLYFKGNVYDPHWRGVHGVAVGASPTGPFAARDAFALRVALPDGRIANSEDPFVWYAPRAERFFAVVKDFTGTITGSVKGLALLESPDGFAWQQATRPLFLKKELVLEDGTRVAVAHLERPQLLLAADGTPRVLYAACSVRPCSRLTDGAPFNVQIPLGAK